MPRSTKAPGVFPRSGSPCLRSEGRRSLSRSCGFREARPEAGPARSCGRGGLRTQGPGARSASRSERRAWRLRPGGGWRGCGCRRRAGRGRRRPTLGSSRGAAACARREIPARSRAARRLPLEALYVTGHSLGRAMAVLFALSLIGDEELSSLAERLRAVYTFGQPLVACEPLRPASPHAPSNTGSASSPEPHDRAADRRSSRSPKGPAASPTPSRQFPLPARESGREAQP